MIRVVRLPSFPNNASAEMSVSFSLLNLGMERNEIQPEVYVGEVAQFTQFSECRDVREVYIFNTRN
jgi:hypothetical protein